MNIKEMLKKVDVQAASLLVLKFMAEASTFLDQLLVDLAEKKEIQEIRLPKEKEHTVELDFVNSSMDASEELKETLDK